MIEGDISKLTCLTLSLFWTYGTFLLKRQKLLLVN